MKFKGVSPRRSIERRLERTLRKEYLYPYLNHVIDVLRKRGGWRSKRRYGLDAEPSDQEYATSDWIYAVGIATAEFERRRQYDGIITEVIKDEIEQINRYHADKFIRDFWRTARVDIRSALTSRDIQQYMREAVEESVGLIKTIPRRFKDELVAKLESGELIKQELLKKRKELTREFIKGELDAPLDLAARERMVARVGKSSGYNLRRIVRDQSNKFTGKLSQVRQQQVGVTHYIWSTSEDDRVRPTHVEKNDRRFAWNSPPPDTGHPGNDIQCRCVALADIDINYLQSKYGKTNPSTTA